MKPSREPEQQRGPDGSRPIWTVVFVLSAVALIAVLSFGSGIVAERYVFSGTWLGTERLRGGLETDGNPEVDVAFPRQAEVREILEDEYFFLPASPEARATFWADVYTVFLEPLRGAPLREELAGEYQGIGIWVEHPEGQFTIVAPIPGSPAARADLRAGDVIVAAGGQDLSRLETDAAMSLIRGPAGSSVVLTIRRPGVPELFDVTVNREAIEIPAVVYEEQADGKVAHITVAIFGDNTTRELDAALRRATDESVAGIVLDLRGNGGGWVTSAQEMIGRFIPENAGPALYQDLDLQDDDDLISEPIVGGGETAFDIPLVVLIDGGTASAAEIVAGAIRDYQRGTLVGGPSFGKGLVQRVHDFEDGSSARVTFARWLTPDQHPIPDEGLAPDLNVKADPGAAGDGQLERAVEVVLGSPPTATPAN